MLSIIVVLMLVCAAGEGVFCCEPCRCYMGSSGLQIANCRGLGQSSVLSTDTLPNHTQALVIWSAAIPTIKENQFVAFQKLQIIRLTVCQISKVERHAFRNMTYMTSIDLSNNLITELPAGLFLDTSGLVEFRLNSNKLKVISINLFFNLKNLKIVNLSSNQINLIEANCFENVPQLEELYLSYNQLTTLNMDFIDNSSSLKMLYLTDNPWHCDESLCGVMMAVVSRGLWKGNQGYSPTCAKPQILQGNQWHELEDHALLQQCTCSPCRCEGPSVVRCSTPLNPARLPDTLPYNITHLHVTAQQFSTVNNSAFSRYSLLQELHLERNQIHNIEPNAFHNLNILSVLSLSYNKLQELPKNIFNSMVNLAKILLNYNNLTRLDKFQFTNMLILKEVDLAFNNISFIEEGCFMNVPSLRTINLNNNQLQTLQLNVINSAMGLERLHLEGNPWRCDEALCGVLDAVVKRTLWGPGGVVPTCAAPLVLAGKPWPELPQHFYPDIFILDSNMNWTRADRATSVLAARDVTLQCRYCFVSRVTWTLNSVKLPRRWHHTLQEALISSLTLEDVHKHDEGSYVCQVSQCPECDIAKLHVIVNTLPPIDIRSNLECGEVISTSIPDIVGRVVKGTSVNKGEFPWHIALYRRVGDEHEYLCGGTIVNPIIILTAAHCFTINGTFTYSAEEFYIGAGKYYSDYNSAEDTFAQKRQVKEYHIPSDYRGYDRNYAADLAVVVVKQAFRRTPVVQPVCMEWDITMDSEHLQHNQIGSIVGWGYVDPNKPKESETLQRLDPPVIGLDQCLNEVPAHFRRWVTVDKFCAGFRTGASICKGDSGGGLVFRWNNTQRYVIRGLASVGPTQNGTCDDSQYGLFTRISHYKTFIQNVINANPVGK